MGPNELPPPSGPPMGGAEPPLSYAPTQPVPVIDPTRPIPRSAGPASRGTASSSAPAAANRRRHRGPFWLVVATAIVALGAGAVLGARSGDDGAAPAGTDQAKATATVRSATSERVSTSTSTSSAPPPTAAPTTVEYGEGIMPDVVCMNLQAAQDEIQTHGVFFSRSKDATGKGRRQILDRNWTVVAQSPAPGEPIGEGDAVLSVVKNDEPNAC